MKKKNKKMKNEKDTTILYRLDYAFVKGKLYQK